MRPIAILSLLFFAGPALAADRGANWRQDLRETWVQDAPQAYGDSPRAPSASGVLLHDRQIRVTAQGDDRYEHLLLRLTGAQTGEHAAPVIVGLDPRFQTLVVHSLRLTHAGEAAERFTAAQLAQALRSQAAEAEPHKRDLNPQLQVSLQVPDAQAGDLLEFEYTVHTVAERFPGLFAGHYAALWSLEPDQPVHWERLRVSWPTGRLMRFQISPGFGGAAPQVRTQEGELDIRWSDQVPVLTEPDTPRWFDRQSLVQLSDFGDWATVAALQAMRYGELPDPTPTLAPPAAAPQMILNALRLVQDKVHAIHGLGAGPYAPAEPARVLQRGYGDGRDLARLLASLLQRLGITAQVALADSRRGERLASTLPSPFVFDTALVVVHSGTLDYWIDPAAPGAAATLATTDPADLRHALLLAAAGGRMLDLPPAAPDSRLRRVIQRFDLRAGNAQPAPLTLITQYRGSWAQALGGTLRAQSPAQLQLTQIQSVMQDYPAATPEGDVALEDGADGPTLQITARFRIPGPLGGTQDPHFDFYAEGLADVVQRRDEATRRLPLSLPWPMKLEQHIEALLPEDFTAPTGTVTIETKAYRYQREVRLAQGKLQITHSYLALADHVEAADYPQFVAANAQVTEALGVRVRPLGMSWQRALAGLNARRMILFAALGVFAALCALAWRRLRGAKV